MPTGCRTRRRCVRCAPGWSALRVVWSGRTCDQTGHRTSTGGRGRIRAAAMVCAPYVRGGVTVSREFHKIPKTLSRPCAQGISNRSGFLCVTNMQNASAERRMRQERIHRTGLSDRVPPSTRGNFMRYVALTLAMIAAATTARAQDAIPDLKGTKQIDRRKLLCHGTGEEVAAQSL
jgi:hypothetical protein